MDLMQAYLYLGLATFLGAALVAAHVMLMAPFTHYEMLIRTNILGEGKIEAALILVSLPAWFLLSKQLFVKVLG